MSESSHQNEFKWIRQFTYQEKFLSFSCPPNLLIVRMNLTDCMCKGRKTRYLSWTWWMDVIAIIPVTKDMSLVSLKQIDLIQVLYVSLLETEKPREAIHFCLESMRNDLILRVWERKGNKFHWESSGGIHFRVLFFLRWRARPAVEGGPNGWSISKVRELILCIKNLHRKPRSISKFHNWLWWEEYWASLTCFGERNSEFYGLSWEEDNNREGREKSSLTTSASNGFQHPSSYSHAEAVNCGVPFCESCYTHDIVVDEHTVPGSTSFQHSCSG